MSTEINTSIADMTINSNSDTNIDKIIDNLDELKKMYDAAHIAKEAGETGLYN